MRFFFYGTLRDADVRRAVLGATAGRIAVEPAHLDGYACVFMRGRSYPVLRRAPGRSSEGVLASGLDARQAALIDRFETGEYRRAEVTVFTAAGEAVTATIYLAARPGLATTTPWRLADWQRRHKPGSLRRWFGGTGPRTAAGGDGGEG